MTAASAHWLRTLAGSLISLLVTLSASGQTQPNAARYYHNVVPVSTCYRFVCDVDRIRKLVNIDYVAV